MSPTVYNREGQRKYLTASEVNAFLNSARSREIAVNSFCRMLALTGCRISEALSLTKRNIDFEAEHVIIQSLKKRGKQIFRSVPLPRDFLNLLKSWFRSGEFMGDRLWPWSRMTGYRRICEVMQEAGLSGTFATPKGLRHGFAVRAIQAQVPLTLVQRWLGHADIKTTAIYTSVTGPEEREIAARMWGSPSKRDPWRRGAAHRHDNRLIFQDFDSESHEGECPSCHEKNARKASAPRRPHPVYPMAASAAISRLSGIIYCLMIQFWLKCSSNFRYFPYTYAFSDRSRALPSSPEAIHIERRKSHQSVPRNDAAGKISLISTC